MPQTITKSDWLLAKKCLTHAWLWLRREQCPPNEADRFRMEQGHQVGALARELFPTGILVTRTPDKTASDLTQELITDPAIGTLFEAAFVAGRFTAHADILTREQGGWHVLEVKSSFSDSSSLKDLIADLAYTVFVLRRCGVLVNSASLVLLSRGFRFGDNPDRLFEIIDQ